MRIDAQKQRPVDALLLAMHANGLRDRQNVPLVELRVQRRTPMSRGSERNALRRHSRIWPLPEIGRHQPRHIHEIGCLGGFTCARTDGHWKDPLASRLTYPSLAPG